MTEDAVLELKDEVKPVIVQAGELVITDDESENSAGNILRSIKALRKKVKEQFGPSVKKAHEAWKASKEILSMFDDPLQEAEKKLKTALGLYLLDKEQEAKRIAYELVEKKRIEEAEALAEQGKNEEAVEVIEKPLEPVVAEKVKPQTSGVSTRKIWSAEVFDIGALARTRPDLVLPNMPALNDLARTEKEKLDIPGVKAVNKISVASR